MTEKKTATVAGVPVTIEAAGGVLTVTIGRFDPAAASGLLDVHPHSGAAAVIVYIAGENRRHGPPAGPALARLPVPWPARGDGEHPAVRRLLYSRRRPARRMRRRLPAGPRPHRLCLRASPDECQWCGTPGRLREVSRADVGHLLPTLGSDEGLWFLNWADGRRGPYPSAQAPWDDWHASSPARMTATTPLPPTARQDRVRRTPDRFPGRSRTGHDCP